MVALWKRVWAGKEALLSVEKTVVVTGQRLAEALQINKAHLALTDLKEYQTIANSFKSSLNEALIRVREQALDFEEVRRIFPTIPRTDIVEHVKTLA